MRVSFLSAACAAFLLGALPVAAHGGSNDQDDRDDGSPAASQCPIQAPAPGWRHRVTHVVRAAHQHARVRIACPVARAEPRHDEHVILAYRWERRWSREEADAWRDRFGRGCPGSDRWERYGDHRAYEDYGMPCHDHQMRYDEAMRDGGMHYDAGDARWRGPYREEDRWSSAEHYDGWRADCDCRRPSATDQYGYLTWPGKTQFGPQPPPEDGPEAGPWQVHP